MNSKIGLGKFVPLETKIDTIHGQTEGKFLQHVTARQILTLEDEDPISQSF